MTKIKTFLKDFLASILISLPARPNQAVVLMYHSVSDNNGKFFTVKPSEFERQMAYLSAHGFNVVSSATLKQYLNQGVIPPKTVVLTFDDGYEDNFLIAWPILKKYGFSATIFLATDLPAKTDRLALLNLEQMKALEASGLIDLESHTAHHLKLTKIDLAEAEREIVLSRDFIGRQFGKKADFFAYPYGRYNDQIVKSLERLGFQLAFTVENGVIKTADNKLLLKRNSVDSAVTVAQFKAMVKFGKI